MQQISKLPKFELPFPMSEYDDRLLRVREGMQQAGIDVQIITDHIGYYWLTGANMRSGWIIVWGGEPIGVVRHLDASTHKRLSWLKNWVECPDKGAIQPYDPVHYTAETLKELNIDNKVIGINFRITGYEAINRLKKLLPDAEIRDFRVETIWNIKSELEQECQFKATKVNQDALMDTINEIEVGWSELDVVERIARHHKKYLGKDYERSELTHCRVGRNLELMHVPLLSTQREAVKIKKGDLLYLEPGTFVKRYVGTMLRMVSFGEPPAVVRRSSNACIEVLNRTIEAYAPGKTAYEVDKVGRDYFVKMELDCQSRTGYCNGIDWAGGAVMSITPNNPLILMPGQIFHCIALHYLPGWGYIGASEQVLITEDGHEVLGDRDRTCERKLFIK